MAIGTPTNLGTATDTGGASAVITTSAAVPIGTAIIIAAGRISQSAVISGVTDTAGNTYRRLGGGADVNRGAEFWGTVTTALLAASSSITVAKTVGQEVSVASVQIPGVKSLDFINAGSISLNPGSATISSTVIADGARSLVIGMACYGNFTLTQPGAPWNNLTGITSAANSKTDWAYQFVQPGSYTYNPTLSLSVAWASVSIAIVEAIPQNKVVRDGVEDNGWIEEMSLVAGWSDVEVDAKGWFDPDLIKSGVLAYNVAAAAGAYAITGQTVNLKFGRVVSAAPGSYSVTGQPATLKFGRKIAALTAAYAINGSAVNLFRGFKVIALSASYTFNGQTVNTKLGRVIAATTGAYNMTGTPATLNRGKSLIADGGSYALIGSAENLLLGRKVAAVTSAYVVNGQIINLKLGRKVAALPGSYLINGQTVNFLTARKLAALGGAYNLNGQDVNLVYSATPPSGGFDNVYRNIFDRIMHPVKLDIDDPWDEKDQPA